MTWTTTNYIRWSSEDGKRTWIQKQHVLHAYRHPGQYRDTWLDDDGQPGTVEITDYRAGRTLDLYPKQHKAILKFSVAKADCRGPFAWVGNVVRDRKLGRLYRVEAVSLQGQKEIDGSQATVVRVKLKNVEEGFTNAGISSSTRHPNDSWGYGSQTLERTLITIRCPIKTFQPKKSGR